MNSRLLKFSAGFVAGLCAILIPRLVPELMTSGDSEYIALFQVGYIILSLVFAILIGITVTIIEWDSDRSLKDTFMSAIAIPGLLSGAFNNAESINLVEATEKDNKRLIEYIQNDAGIQEFRNNLETPKELGETTTNTYNSRLFDLSIISSVHAGENPGIQIAEFDIGIKKNKRSYAIVLGTAKSKKAAFRKVKVLLKKSSISIPTKIIRGDDNTYLIITEEKQNKANALLQAVRLKNMDLSPSLLEIK